MSELCGRRVGDRQRPIPRSGVLGIGQIGVQGLSFSYGGWFRGVGGVGVIAEGRNGGLFASCVTASCAAVTAGGQRFGLTASGAVAVYGEQTFSTPVGFDRNYAGFFRGNVGVTQDMRVEGSLSAPIIELLQAQIAALTARLEALEGTSSGGGAAIHIEAEAYDVGGQGVGYNDSSPGNTGGAFRTDDVDIKDSAEGGYAVGWITAGEWLAYTVDVLHDHAYTLAARVGSALPGRTFHIELNGVDVTGPISVPHLADWDQYATVTTGRVPFKAGRNVLRVIMGPQDWMDLQWVEVRP